MRKISNLPVGLISQEVEFLYIRILASFKACVMVRFMVSGQGPIFFLLHIIKMQSLYVENHVFIKVIRKEEKREGEDIWVKYPLIRIYKLISSRVFFIINRAIQPLLLKLLLNEHVLR